jgi:hypothetical protein
LTTNRLSVYLRCLNALDDAGVRTISSQSLAEQFHLNAAQIRKDLAYFGEFGVRGVGYYVRDLKRHLRQILGLDRKLRVLQERSRLRRHRNQRLPPARIRNWCVRPLRRPVRAPRLKTSRNRRALICRHSWG